MKHKIDPKVDCVFKAILGTAENRNLLIHFLNAILKDELPAPICHVDILNPYNEKEFLSDKLSIVDVKARDEFERLYQVEIQMVSSVYLPDRIAYNWADIYAGQLQSGQQYDALKPTYAIWLLGEILLQNDEQYVHNFKLRDTLGATLNNHGGIWLLELDKFHTQHIDSEDKRWLKFFSDGAKLDDEKLPDWMITTEMKQAMNTLRVFSEKEHEYDRYRARQEYIRIRETERSLLEKALQREKEEREAKEIALSEKETALSEKETALSEKEVERKAKEAALAEIAYLRKLLETKPEKNSI
jgi:predicted transposase/invertase (TIGR01784 family)